MLVGIGPTQKCYHGSRQDSFDEAAVSFRLPKGPSNVCSAAWNESFTILQNDSGVISICYTAILEIFRWIWLGRNGSRLKSIWCTRRSSRVIPSAVRPGKCSYCFPGCYSFNMCVPFPRLLWSDPTYIGAIYIKQPAIVTMTGFNLWYRTTGDNSLSKALSY